MPPPPVAASSAVIFATIGHPSKIAIVACLHCCHTLMMVYWPQPVWIGGQESIDLAHEQEVFSPLDVLDNLDKEGGVLDIN